MGPMFRRERRRKDATPVLPDWRGGAGQSDAPGIDAELIEMLVAFFNKAGLAARRFI